MAAHMLQHANPGSTVVCAPGDDFSAVAASALEGAASVRVVLLKGGRETRWLPMLWPTGVEMVDGSHRTVRSEPDIDLYVFPMARLAGFGALPQVGGRYVFAETLLPKWISHFIINDIQHDRWSHPSKTAVLRLPTAISIIHHNLVFGHWLTEMFPKILLLKYMMPRLCHIPIILPSSVPAFVRAIIADVLGKWPICTYDPVAQHVEVEKLLMPGMLNVDYYYHSHFAELLRKHIDWSQNLNGIHSSGRTPLLHGPRSGGGEHISRFFDRAKSGVSRIFSLSRAFPRSGSFGPRRDCGDDGCSEVGFSPNLAAQADRKLFISRRHTQSRFRSLENSDELEAVARECEFEVIYPEKMEWAEQVRTFSAARIISGEFGSAMHNAMFAGHGTKVICFNWINDVQSRIANFRLQRVGYLLPTDNRPVLWRLDADRQAYCVDPIPFRRALSEIGCDGDYE